MRNLIAHLNEKAGLTPDEIVKTLHGPWQCLRGHTVEWVRENRKRRIFLFTTNTLMPGYRTGLYRSLHFVDAVADSVDHWPSAVFTRAQQDHWFFAYEEDAVPFIIGVHDVQALENFDGERE